MIIINGRFNMGYGTSSIWVLNKTNMGLIMKHGDWSEEADKPRQSWSHWIGWRENLPETMVSTIKYRGFLYIFPSSNSVR